MTAVELLMLIEDYRKTVIRSAQNLDRFNLKAEIAAHRALIEGIQTRIDEAVLEAVAKVTAEPVDIPDPVREALEAGFPRVALLDPKPYIWGDGSRSAHEELSSEALLYVDFQPRDGYSQNEEDYR